MAVKKVSLGFLHCSLKWLMTSQTGSIRDLCEKEFLINSSIAIKSERYRVERKPCFRSTKVSVQNSPC